MPFIHINYEEVNKINIIVIVPVYNDRETIGKVIDELSRAGYDNILIVDDGSTQDIFHEVCNRNVHYLRHIINMGQGAALQTGFKYAINHNAEFVITFDADGQHDVDDIVLLLKPVMNNEVDVVLGSRFLNKSHDGIKFTRLFILKLARVVNFFFSGIYLSDAHNGLRAFNRKAIESIRITENRMSHASEIIFEIRKHQLRHKEIPVNIRYTTYSKTKGQSGWNSIRILMDIIIHKLSNKLL